MGAENFSGPTGRQDYKAKGEGSHALCLAQTSVDLRRIVYRDCRMVPNA
jgi:hypothetical protein